MFAIPSGLGHEASISTLTIYNLRSDRDWHFLSPVTCSVSLQDNHCSLKFRVLESSSHSTAQTACVSRVHPEGLLNMVDRTWGRRWCRIFFRLWIGATSQHLLHRWQNSRLAGAREHSCSTLDPRLCTQRPQEVDSWLILEILWFQEAKPFMGQRWAPIPLSSFGGEGVVAVVKMLMFRTWAHMQEGAGWGWEVRSIFLPQFPSTSLLSSGDPGLSSCSVKKLISLINFLLLFSSCFSHTHSLSNYDQAPASWLDMVVTDKNAHYQTKRGKHADSIYIIICIYM